MRMVLKFEVAKIILVTLKKGGAVWRIIRQSRGGRSWN